MGSLCLFFRCCSLRILLWDSSPFNKHFGIGRCFSRPTNSRKSKVYQLGAGFKVFLGLFTSQKKKWRRFKPGILTNICFVTGLKLNRSNLVQVSYNQILKNSGVFCVVYQGHQNPMIYHHVHFRSNLQGFPVLDVLMFKSLAKTTQSTSFTTEYSSRRRCGGNHFARDCTEPGKAENVGTA